MSSRTQVSEVEARPHAPRLRSTASLGERLRRLRVERGLTQQELAGDYCSKEYISQIERGRTRPTAETVQRLAERLGVDAAYLERGVSSADYERAEALVARVETLVSAKRYREAIDAAADVAVQPEAPELELRALLAEGWARMYEGELRTALERFERARELASSPGLGPLELAEALFRLGCCRYTRSSKRPTSRPTGCGSTSSAGARAATGASATGSAPATTSSAPSSSPRHSTLRSSRRTPSSRPRSSATGRGTGSAPAGSPSRPARSTSSSTTG